MADRASPSALSRLKNVGAFVAIVWGVAASFVVFELATLSGSDRLFESSHAFDNLSLSPQVRQSTVCSVADRKDNRDSRRSGAEVRADAWRLGVQAGSHARWAEWLADSSQAQSDSQARAWLVGVRQMVAQTRAAVERLATGLKVPPPGTFTPVNRATAIADYVTFVEADTQPTARALATAYAPDACEAYKMGEYWGYSLLIRAAVAGERNVFAAELDYYARRLDLPEPLWRPMTARTPSGATSAQIQSESAELTEKLTEHLREH
jgi:hypothetical protein